jgi:hypothetical protein
MMLLPTPPRRATLRAFGLAISVGAGIIIAAAGAGMGIPYWPAAGAIVAAVLAMVGWAWPRVVEHPYHYWNRMAKRYAAVARLALTGLCFFVVVAAGRAGSRAMMGPVQGSGWFRRPTLPAATYLSPSRESGGRRLAAGSLGDLIGWSRESRSWWALSLVPLLGLLNLVQTSERGSFGGDIYTLY